MLFFVGPLVVAISIFFACVSYWTRGDVSESAGWAVLGWVFGMLVFALAVPGLATGFSDEWRYPVEGEITSDIKKVGDKFSFWVGEEFISLDEYDEEYLEFAPLRDGETSDYFRRRCDVTPSWAAPYNMGSCTHIISTDKDFD